MMSIHRITTGLRRRIMCDTRWLIVAAGPLDAPVPAPAGTTLIRISATTPSVIPIAQQAMEAAHSSELAIDRIGAGDEFFGLAENGVVLSFGWWTMGPRMLAGTKAFAAPHRVIGYHAHTLASARGRGLYTAVLHQMRYALGSTGRTQLVADVQKVNMASRAGLAKAGFVPIAETRERTVFNLFHHVHGRDLVTDGTPEFQAVS